MKAVRGWERYRRRESVKKAREERSGEEEKRGIDA